MTELIIALAVSAFCVVVLFRRASAATSEAKVQLLQSFGIYVGAVTVSGLVRYIFNGVLFEYFGTFMALIPLYLGSRLLCNTLDDVERQVNVPTTFNIAFVCVLFPLLWVALNTGVYNKDVYAYPMAILVTFTSFLLARTFHTLESVEEIRAELPENMHFTGISKSQLLTAALVAAIAFHFIFLGIFAGTFSYGNLLSDGSIQIGFFFLMLVVAYMLLRGRIRQAVFGGDNAEVNSYSDLWIMAFSVVVGFIAHFIGFNSAGAAYSFLAAWVLCVIAQAVNCAVGRASKLKRSIFAVLVCLLGFSVGLSILTLVLFVVVILGMAKFLKFEIHDMASFGHSVRGYDNKGNFNVINTETGLDQDGRKWKEK